MGGFKRSRANEKKLMIVIGSSAKCQENAFQSDGWKKRKYSNGGDKL